jgi:hypothetical protein
VFGFKIKLTYVFGNDCLLIKRSRGSKAQTMNAASQKTKRLVVVISTAGQ